MKVVLASAALVSLVLAAYGGLSYLLGDVVALVTIMMMGLPILAFLVMQWVLPPLLAVYFGVVARFSPAISLVLGVPLVLLSTFVSPVVSTGHPDLPVPVPWLAVYAKQRKIVEPLLLELSVYWLSLFALAFLLAFVSRKVWPPKKIEVPRDLARDRMRTRLAELKQMTPERDKSPQERRPWN